jgi:predicted nucleotidyltransferase
MDKVAIRERLLARRAELEQLGVAHLSIFGSISRGDFTAKSDVDIAVTFDPERTPKGFSFVSRLETIEAALRRALGSPVDVVAEPARRPDLQAAIERDRLRVY